VQELLHEIKPAAQVCSKCPWRIDNQRAPLADNPHFYEPVCGDG
jgi:hypothetical protein